MNGLFNVTGTLDVFEGTTDMTGAVVLVNGYGTIVSGNNWSIEFTAPAESGEYLIVAEYVTSCNESFWTSTNVTVLPEEIVEESVVYTSTSNGGGGGCYDGWHKVKGGGCERDARPAVTTVEEEDNGNVNAAPESELAETPEPEQIVDETAPAPTGTDGENLLTGQVTGGTNWASWWWLLALLAGIAILGGGYYAWRK